MTEVTITAPEITIHENLTQESLDKLADELKEVEKQEPASEAKILNLNEQVKDKAYILLTFPKGSDVPDNLMSSDFSIGRACVAGNLLIKAALQEVGAKELK